MKYIYLNNLIKHSKKLFLIFIIVFNNHPISAIDEHVLISHQIKKLEVFEFNNTEDIRLFVWLMENYDHPEFDFYYEYNWLEYSFQNNEWIEKDYLRGTISGSFNYPFFNGGFKTDIELSRTNDSKIFYISNSYEGGFEGCLKYLYFYDESTEENEYLYSAGFFGSTDNDEHIVRFDLAEDSTLYLGINNYYSDFAPNGLLKSQDYGYSWDPMYPENYYFDFSILDIKLSDFNENNIILKQGNYSSALLNITTDLGETWYDYYGSDNDIQEIYDLEFISADSVIFNTDIGRFISAYSGISLQQYDEIISTESYYDITDNQFYLNIENTLQISSNKGLNFENLVDSLDSKIIDIFGRRNSSDIYFATSRGIYKYDNITLDTLIFLDENELGVNNAEQFPDTPVLYQNYPNPFNPNTTIQFSLPVHASVNLTVYDLKGRMVVELLNGKMTAGFHQSIWNAEEIAAGLYLIRMNISTDNKAEFLYSAVQKVILLK